MNVATVRKFLSDVIADRKKKEIKEDEDIDMISILIQDEMYGKNSDDIIDDVLIMFFAGSKTVQTTVTNTITHLLHRPDVREKFEAEINPMLEQC